MGGLNAGLEKDSYTGFLADEEDYLLDSIYQEEFRSEISDIQGTCYLVFLFSSVTTASCPFFIASESGV